jgi:DNA adenine methylase
MATIQGKIITRYGSKTMLLKDLLPLVPVHECYVEVFGGSLALFLAKAKAKVEVINDIDGDLVNLYRIVKHHPNALEQELSGELNSRETFQHFVKQPGLTDIQRAARYLFLNRLSFSGGRGPAGYGVTKCTGSYSGGLTRWTSVTQNVRLLHERFDGVAIEQLPWQRLLKNYDRRGGLMFLDPPYVDGDPKGYVPFTMAEMEELAARVKQLQSAWIVTVGDTPAMRELWAFGQQKRVHRAKGGKQTGERLGELIITKN